MPIICEQAGLVKYGGEWAIGNAPVKMLLLILIPGKANANRKAHGIEQTKILIKRIRCNLREESALVQLFK